MFHSQLHRQLRWGMAIGFSLVLVACSTSQEHTNSQENDRQQVELPENSPVPQGRGTIEEVVVTGTRKQGWRDRLRRSHDRAAASKQAVSPALVSTYPSPYHGPNTRDTLHRYKSRPDQERYPEFDSNSVVAVREQPVSTFAVDVDTASYSNLRRLLNQGQLPQTDAIRVEEMINYFDYDYADPKTSSKHPFAVHTEIAPSPWHKDRHLLHIGVQGKSLDHDKLPAANLVFLIDVSGSMQSNDKLPLLQSAMKLLTRQLRSEDKVAIVVYAGAAGVVLEPTSGDRKAQIAGAIDRLHAGGSTHGSAGIHLAYQLAEQHFVNDGVNRVILATDGDFNVGTVDQRALKELIVKKRSSGVALTVLGFGGGNYNDAVMQELAQSGDGNAAYIDTLNEARKVLVDELAATLTTIAKDVKIQVEFNPAVVSEYRLVGFETRALRREDFANDKIDAGEIGAGHSVTALYEVSLVGSHSERLPPLRYGAGESSEGAKSRAKHLQELAHLRLRYKAPQGSESVLIEQPMLRSDIIGSLEQASATFRFSAAVAGFGQLLRGGEHVAELSFADVLSLGQGARGNDHYGYRSEFANLVRTASALSTALDDKPPLQVGYRGD